MTMKFKRSYCTFYLFSIITVLLFEKSRTTGDVELNKKTSSAFTEEAERFLRHMDESVDPCINLYDFACGGFMKKDTYFNTISPGYDRYVKLMNDIKEILESERDIPGYDISVARNIYTNCKKIIPNEISVRELIDNIAKKIGLLSDVYKTDNGKVQYKWNKQFNWIDGVHKLRDIGLNFRFLIGLYVSPRSQSDKRNILEIREPFLQSDYINPSDAQENLKIVNAREFINSLNGSFPLQKFIEGFLPTDTNFSWEGDIRVDEAYVKKLVNDLNSVSIQSLVDNLYKKLETEIKRLLPSKYHSNREKACRENAIFYDYNFQVAVSKTFLTEKKRDFIADLMNKIVKTAKILTSNTASFDEKSRTQTIKKLSDLQMMIGYGNNTITTPALEWNDIDYHKYVNNIFKISKYQMDAKFRQLNLVKDVREWEMEMTPFTYNAAYYLLSNTLYMPAFFLTSEMHKLDLPNYIHYGSIGFYIAHELGHAIDYSTYCDRYFEVSENYNFAGSNVVRTKNCLRQAFHNLTGGDKDSEKEDFADLAGYKIAYYSFLDSEKENGYYNLFPELNYNSRQMFWITSASAMCSKDAYKMSSDGVHSPNVVRVVLPLSNLLEFAQDFNCPVGSPMNPTIKCEFL